MAATFLGFYGIGLPLALLAVVVSANDWDDEDHDTTEVSTDALSSTDWGSLRYFRKGPNRHDSSDDDVGICYSLEPGPLNNIGRNINGAGSLNPAVDSEGVPPQEEKIANLQLFSQRGHPNGRSVEHRNNSGVHGVHWGREISEGINFSRGLVYKPPGRFGRCWIRAWKMSGRCVISLRRTISKKPDPIKARTNVMCPREPKKCSEKDITCSFTSFFIHAVVEVLDVLL